MTDDLSVRHVSALEAVLDEAARARGLAAEIGPDIPLALPATSAATTAQDHA